MSFYILIVYQRTLGTTEAPHSVCGKSSKSAFKHNVSNLKKTKPKYMFQR